MQAKDAGDDADQPLANFQIMCHTAGMPITGESEHHFAEEPPEFVKELQRKYNSKGKKYVDPIPPLLADKRYEEPCPSVNLVSKFKRPFGRFLSVVHVAPFVNIQVFSTICVCLL